MDRASDIFNSKEGNGRFSEEKLRKRLFVTFTRDVAASPGSEKVFAELFSKSDRLLKGISHDQR